MTYFLVRAVSLHYRLDIVDPMLLFYRTSSGPLLQRTILSNYRRLAFRHRRGLLGGSAGTCPLNNGETPMISSFNGAFASIFWLLPWAETWRRL